MVTKFLVLNGPHAAGKTSLREQLDALGYHTAPEIAQVLIDERGYAWGDEGTSTFQRVIFERERKRDRQLLSSGVDSVIETWHVGNIAHSEEVATQSLTQRQRRYLERILANEDLKVKALFLQVPIAEIPERSSHVDAADTDTLDFYREISANILEVYDAFGIDYDVIENPWGSFDTVVDTASAIATEFFSDS